MTNSSNLKSFSVLTASVAIICLSLVALIYASPLVAAQLGLSTGQAAIVVNLIDKYQTATAVVAIVGALSGVGSISSALVASALYLLKKKGKAKAAAF